MDLPSAFLDLHGDLLFNLFQKHGPVVRIAPREPLGDFDPNGPTGETVTLVTVRCVNDRGTVRFEAFSKADAEVAEAWAKRHRQTTREEFDWLPSFHAGQKSP